MPLDGHSYLISQGWPGLGTGLRQDALIRPLAIPQKRTLSGLGKDRDEAFPFWDHLFSVAAKTIQVKLHKDDDDVDSSSDKSNPLPASNTQLLDRTSTGILSNKAPKRGTPASTSASASSSTALTTATPPSPSSPNLLTTANQEAAKRILYSHFFRGPVLGPDSNSNNSTIPNTDSTAAKLAPTTIDSLSENTTTYIPFANDGSTQRATPMAMAKAKMTDTTKTCEVHQNHDHDHQHKRKRDKVTDKDEDVNTSQQRKRERKEKRENSKKNQKQVEKKRAEHVDKKEEKEKEEEEKEKEEEEKKKKEKKKQSKFKATTGKLEEPIPRKKRKRSDSSTSAGLNSVIGDTAPAEDLGSGVKKKKKEKTRDRNDQRKHAKSDFVAIALEKLESKKRKRRKSKVE